MNGSLTPVIEDPLKPKTMSFPDAIREIMKGNCVARISWANPDYCYMKDDWLSIYTKGEEHTWTISAGDMEGQDWIITVPHMVAGQLN